MNLRVKQFIHQSALAFVWLLVTQAFVIWMCPNVLQSPYEAYQLAMSLKERGDVERAHRTMLLAVAEEPHNPGQRPQASLGLGEALLNLGDAEQVRGLLASLDLQRLIWKEERHLAQLM